MAEEFDATLEAGVAMEQRLDWEGALQLYESMLRSLEAEASHDAPREARRATVELRRGNVLIFLLRVVEALLAFCVWLCLSQPFTFVIILSLLLSRHRRVWCKSR